MLKPFLTISVKFHRALLLFLRRCERQKSAHERGCACTHFIVGKPFYLKQTIKFQFLLLLYTLVLVVVIVVVVDYLCSNKN